MSVSSADGSVCSGHQELFSSGPAEAVVPTAVSRDSGRNSTMSLTVESALAKASSHKQQRARRRPRPISDLQKRTGPFRFKTNILLSEEQRAGVITTWPEFQLSPESFGTTVVDHPRAAVERDISSMFMKVRHRRTERVVDLGGNPVQSISSGYANVHICRTVETTRDQIRAQDADKIVMDNIRRKESMGTALNEAERRYLQHPRKVVCDLNALQCDAKADVITANHVYDLNVMDVIAAMNKHQSSVAELWMILHPNILLGQPAEIDELKMRIEPDPRNDKIRYHFIGEATNGYTHRLSDITSFMIKTLVSDGYQNYTVELKGPRASAYQIVVKRAMRPVTVDVDSICRYWTMANTTLAQVAVLLPKGNYDGSSCSRSIVDWLLSKDETSVDYDVALLPKNLYDNVFMCAYRKAQSLLKEDLSFTEVFDTIREMIALSKATISYAHSYNHRVDVCGTSVTVPKSVDVDLVRRLCVHIVVRAKWAVKNDLELVKQQNNVEEVRQKAAKTPTIGLLLPGLWGKLKGNNNNMEWNDSKPTKAMSALRRMLLTGLEGYHGMLDTKAPTPYLLYEDFVKIGFTEMIKKHLCLKERFEKWFGSGNELGEIAPEFSELLMSEQQEEGLEHRTFNQQYQPFRQDDDAPALLRAKVIRPRPRSQSPPKYSLVGSQIMDWAQVHLPRAAKDYLANLPEVEQTRVLSRTFDPERTGGDGGDQFMVFGMMPALADGIPKDLFDPERKLESVRRWIADESNAEEEHLKSEDGTGSGLMVGESANFDRNLPGRNHRTWEDEGGEGNDRRDETAEDKLFGRREDALTVTCRQQLAFQWKAHKMVPYCMKTGETGLCRIALGAKLEDQFGAFSEAKTALVALGVTMTAVLGLRNILRGRSISPKIGGIVLGTTAEALDLAALRRPRLTLRNFVDFKKASVKVAPVGKLHQLYTNMLLPNITTRLPAHRLVRSKTLEPEIDTNVRHLTPVADLLRSWLRPNETSVVGRTSPSDLKDVWEQTHKPARSWASVTEMDSKHGHDANREEVARHLAEIDVELPPLPIEDVMEGYLTSLGMAKSIGGGHDQKRKEYQDKIDNVLDAYFLNLDDDVDLADVPEGTLVALLNAARNDRWKAVETWEDVMNLSDLEERQKKDLLVSLVDRRAGNLTWTRVFDRLLAHGIGAVIFLGGNIYSVHGSNNVLVYQVQDDKLLCATESGNVMVRPSATCWKLEPNWRHHEELTNTMERITGEMNMTEPLSVRTRRRRAPVVAHVDKSLSCIATGAVTTMPSEMSMTKAPESAKGAARKTGKEDKKKAEREGPLMILRKIEEQDRRRDEMVEKHLNSILLSPSSPARRLTEIMSNPEDSIVPDACSMEGVCSENDEQDLKSGYERTHRRRAMSGQYAPVRERARWFPAESRSRPQEYRSLEGQCAVDILFAAGVSKDWDAIRELLIVVSRSLHLNETSWFSREVVAVALRILGYSVVLWSQIGDSTNHWSRLHLGGGTYYCHLMIYGRHYWRTSDHIVPDRRDRFFDDLECEGQTVPCVDYVLRLLKIESLVNANVLVLNMLEKIGSLSLEHAPVKYSPKSPSLSVSSSVENLEKHLEEKHALENNKQKFRTQARMDKILGKWKSPEEFDDGKCAVRAIFGALKRRISEETIEKRLRHYQADLNSDHGGSFDVVAVILTLKSLGYESRIFCAERDQKTTNWNIYETVGNDNCVELKLEEDHYWFDCTSSTDGVARSEDHEILGVWRLEGGLHQILKDHRGKAHPMGRGRHKSYLTSVDSSEIKDVSKEVGNLRHELQQIKDRQKFEDFDPHYWNQISGTYEMHALPGMRTSLQTRFDTVRHLIAQARPLAVAELPWPVLNRKYSSQPAEFHRQRLRMQISQVSEYRDYLLAEERGMVALMSTIWDNIFDSSGTPSKIHVEAFAYANSLKVLKLIERRKSGLNVYECVQHGAELTCEDDNYDVCWDGVDFLDINRVSRPSLHRTGFCYEVRATTTFVIVTKELKLYQTRRILTTIQWDRFEGHAAPVVLIEGVPGCGKTHEIVQSAKSFDLVITETRATKDEISQKLEALGKTRIVVRTMDSFMLNERRSFRKVYIDEGLMAHPGQIDLVASIAGARQVFVIGDRKQLNFISRVAQFEVKHSVYGQFSRIEYRNVSYRCPQDVAFTFNRHYQAGFYSNSAISTSMRVEPIPGVRTLSHVPAAKLLTFTQDEKAQVQTHFGKNLTVNTVHEVQGCTFDVVQLVRINAKKLPIFESASHVLVALTRHRKLCIYNTVAREDLITQTIYGSSARSFPDLEGAAARLRFENTRAQAETVSERQSLLSTAGKNVKTKYVTKQKQHLPIKSVTSTTSTSTTTPSVVQTSSGTSDVKKPNSVATSSRGAGDGAKGRGGRIPADKSSGQTSVRATKGSKGSSENEEKESKKTKWIEKKKHRDQRRRTRSDGTRCNVPVTKGSASSKTSVSGKAKGSTPLEMLDEADEDEEVEGLMATTTLSSPAQDEKRMSPHGYSVHYTVLPESDASAGERELTLESKKQLDRLQAPIDLSELLDQTEFCMRMMPNAVTRLPSSVPVRPEVNWIAKVRSKAFRLPYDSSNVVADLQNCYVQCFPKCATTDNEFDELIFETSDKSFAVQDVKFDLSRLGMDIERLHTRGMFMPKLKTAQPQKRVGTLKQALEAAGKRTCNAPTIALPVDHETQAMRTVQKLLMTFGDPAAPSLLGTFAARPVSNSRQNTYLWLERQAATKRQALARLAAEDFPFDLETFVNRYDLMIKADPKNKMEHTSMDEYAATSNIVSHPTWINMIFGPIMNEMLERLQQVLAKNILIMIKKDPQAIERHMNTFLDPSRKYQQLEIDMSKFDKSQQLEIHHVKMLLLKLLGFDDYLLGLWETSHYHATAADLLTSLKAKIFMQCKTGDVGTALLNTITSLAVIAAVGDLENIVAAGYFMGDDSLIYLTNKVNAGKLTQDLANKFNLSAKSLSYHCGYFCSYFVLFTDGWIYLVPDPLKRIERLGKVIYCVDESELVIRWQSFAALFEGIDYEVPMEKLKIAVAERYGTSVGLRQACSGLLKCAKNYSTFKSLYRQEEAGDAIKQLEGKLKKVQYIPSNY